MSEGRRPTREQLHVAWVLMSRELDKAEGLAHDKVVEVGRLLGVIDRLHDVLEHLAWLDAQHGILEGLYEWDHDPLGYPFARTCSRQVGDRRWTMSDDEAARQKEGAGPRGVVPASVGSELEQWFHSGPAADEAGQAVASGTAKKIDIRFPVRSAR